MAADILQFPSAKAMAKRPAVELNGEIITLPKKPPGLTDAQRTAILRPFEILDQCWDRMDRVKTPLQLARFEKWFARVRPELGTTAALAFDNWIAVQRRKKFVREV